MSLRQAKKIAKALNGTAVKGTSYWKNHVIVETSMGSVKLTDATYILFLKKIDKQEKQWKNSELKQRS